MIKIKRPIVIITLGAILGIILGLNLKLGQILIIFLLSSFIALSKIVAKRRGSTLLTKTCREKTPALGGIWRN